MRRQRRSREADGRSAEVQAKLIPRLGSRIAEELLADGSESPPPPSRGGQCGAQEGGDEWQEGEKPVALTLFVLRVETDAGDCGFTHRHDGSVRRGE